MSPETWFAVAAGQLTWAEAVAQNLIAASGTRADLGDILPLGITRPTGLVE
jgi:hypothetical protein